MLNASDAARHAIQRDLHDGAQQRFLSVAISLQLAELALENDPDEAQGLLCAAVSDLETGLSELDDLTRGLLPAAVRHEGLVAAIGRLVRESAVDAVLDARVDGPVGDAARRAAYFVVSEALANAGRHAPGARVRVSLRDAAAPRRLRIVIADDGPGGADPDAGSGLRGLAQRLARLGGELRVISRRGHGTTIVADVPRANGVARHTTPTEVPRFARR